MIHEHIFGQVTEFKPLMVNCAVGNLVVLRVINPAGKIQLEKMKLCTKATLWHYIFYLWSLNKNVFPFTEIKEEKRFFKEARTVMETYMLTKYRFDQVSKYFNRQTKLVYATKLHLVEFINDTVQKLPNLVLPIARTYATKEALLLDMLKEDARLNRQMRDQHQSYEELVDMILEKVESPYIRTVSPSNQVAFARLNFLT